MATKKNRFSRGAPKRNLIRQIRIYTEGEFTEKEYLQGILSKLNEVSDFRKKFRLSIIPSKGKSSPKNLRKSIRLDEIDSDLKEFFEIWVLLDKDNWPDSDIEALSSDAKIRSKASLFEVLLSNPKFELWLLLHFEDAFGVRTSAEVDKRLSKHLPQYRKHCDANRITLDMLRAATNRAKERGRRGETVNSEVFRLTEHLSELADGE